VAGPRSLITAAFAGALVLAACGTPDADIVSSGTAHPPTTGEQTSGSTTTGSAGAPDLPAGFKLVDRSEYGFRFGVPEQFKVREIAGDDPVIQEGLDAIGTLPNGLDPGRIASTIGDSGAVVAQQGNQVVSTMGLPIAVPLNTMRASLDSITSSPDSRMHVVEVSDDQVDGKPALRARLRVDAASTSVEYEQVYVVSGERTVVMTLSGLDQSLSDQIVGTLQVD